MKTFTAIFVSFLLVQGAFSQIKFGIKAGLNLADQSVSGYNVISRTALKSDYNAGILANINIAESIILQPELVYSGQGAAVKDSSSARVNYNYLNIPILIKYQHSTGLFIETGPQFGFLISAKYKSNDFSMDDKNVTKPTDFAWVLGIGYKIPDLNLGLDVRYNWGLTDVDNGSLFTVKNQVFQIGVFYIF
jgi:hypothetical protein